jgi:peptide/nickel transport system permease protein
MNDLKIRTHKPKEIRQIYFETFKRLFQVVFNDKFGRIGILVVCFFVLVAVLSPFVAPFKPYEKSYGSEGLLRLKPPSLKHFLGTTWYGRDVFSQLIHGTRIVLVVGFVSALMVVIVGVTIGLVAGYYGGIVDDILMRVTDLAYGIPFLPFAVVLIPLLGRSIWCIITAIVVIFWRSTARIIRAQTLSLRERQFILAARVAGASDFKIIYKHILPQVLPISLLYGSLALGWAVVAEASISFLGLSDPDSISWGQVLHDAFASQGVRSPWWWYIPPGILIQALVLSVFFIGRAFELIVNPKLKVS